MAASIVYNDVAEGATLGTGELFEGKKFWVAQRVPHRAALLDLIRANGGHTVMLEKHADWMIADHFRKDCAPGTISYEFIHKSIAKGEVLDANDFPAGPRIGTAREPGSIVRPAKGSRNAFTPDEDRILYTWVKEAKASGEKVSGNELYKQLEQKHPRHTWQSWRDRYLKHLMTRPPSALKPPDNAPPSPPSDPSSRAPELPVAKDAVAEATVASKPRLIKNKDKAQTITVEEETTRLGPASSKQQAAHVEYSVEQLAASFTTEDWEELYAFVDHIDSFSNDQFSYESSWQNWAADKDNQTAEQWKQYHEKVVRPQWRRDPISRREHIRKKVIERHANKSPAQSQNWSQTLTEAAAAPQTEEAASAKPPTRASPDVLPSDLRLESELTAQQETPKYIRDGFESALKRIRGEDEDVPTMTEAPRPSKIQKRASLSPTLVEPEEAVDTAGAQEQPLEINSAESSQQASVEPELQEEALLSQSREQIAQMNDEEDELESMGSDDDLPRIAPIPRPSVLQQDSEDDTRSIASSTDFVHIAPLPKPPMIPEDEADEEGEEEAEDEENEEDELPTPRATKPTAFDTQAILSSPSQLPARLPRLPHPPSSPPPQHPVSSASTTQSIHEFRESLTGPPFPPPSPTASTTSTASNSTSASATSDPDPPLSAPELDTFFAQQAAAGFSNAFIARALKRTRFRPRLALQVLEAWKHGRPLPRLRGVWSVEEDVLVERGDGEALRGLCAKHSLDGWGGVTERVRWLRVFRER